jgi:nitroimidazol reductase NimA-like FMN-containing flavoprotein (pyridoxamine 5'-phosphate oxidase superfamily)
MKETTSLRRRDKQIGERAEIDAVIRASKVCRLALALDNEPYLLPISFGYDGEALYLHTARAGRKIDFFEGNPRVCFEFEGPCEVVGREDVACGWTMHYASVIGYGTLSELTSADDKRFGLNQIMHHYSGRDWTFPAKGLAPTRVWRIAIESLSGKRSPAPPAD